MANITIFAPAKLNLHLRVGNRQLDGFHSGFHSIESIFLALSFGDTLQFETVQGEGLEIIMKGASAELTALPPEQNIITRAVAAFREKTGFKTGLRVTVDKRIPAGGGLGGGSSNAAATLLALNSLAQTANSGKNSRLSDDSVRELGANLGSDVPFFLYQTTAAWVSGRGEQIVPLVAPKPLLELAFVLVSPGFSSETAAAYRLLDEFRVANPVRPSNERQNPSGLLKKALAFPPEQWPFANDFLEVFTAHYGENSDFVSPCSAYRRIISQLRDGGAGFAGLSGSGSTCFGVFTNPALAETAADFLSKAKYVTNVSFPLANFNNWY